MALAKEYSFVVPLFLLMMQMIWAKDELFLEVLSFNSSKVDLACRYEGNMTGVFFKVNREQYTCFEYKSGCDYVPHYDCKFHCEELGEPNLVVFSVHLNGSCQERVNIRCSARTMDLTKELNLDTELILTAQSDVPEITIDGERLVEVDLKPVPIMCTMKNKCNKTRLEISGVHMTSLDINHTQVGSRFTTTAKTTAIFHTVGNYSITCKEAGKDAAFSKNLNIEVEDQTSLKFHSGEPRSAESSMDGELDPSANSKIALAATIPSIVLLMTLLSWIMVHCRKRICNRKNDKGSGNAAEVASEEETPLMDDQNNNRFDGVVPPEEDLQFDDQRKDRLLWKYANNLREEEMLSSHFLEIMSSLIKKGASPFAPFNGTTTFTLFLQESSFHPEMLQSPSALVFLKDALDKGDFSREEESILNDIIKSFPRAIIESKPGVIPFENLLVKICLAMTEADPSCRDHKDKKGRTPLHNLMEMLSIDDLWRINKLDIGSKTDNLWCLMSRLISSSNVIIKDLENITPYFRVLWWKEHFPNALFIQHLSEKITNMLKFSQDNVQQREETQQGLSKLQKKQGVIKVLSSVCGIWMNEDAKHGKTITNFIENCEYPSRVHKMKIEDVPTLQDGPNYNGYFAVVSSQSLEYRSFSSHLISLLRLLASGNRHRRSTLVLVSVNKDINELINNWHFNVQNVPRVKLDGDNLHQIASSLQGPPLNLEPSASLEYVGIGLAWLFLYSFDFEGIQERQETSKTYINNPGMVSRCRIFILPESCEVSSELEQGLPEDEFEELDDRINDPDGYHPFCTKQGIYKGSNTQQLHNVSTYICVVFPKLFQDMFKSGELDGVVMKKLFSLFTQTMRSILLQFRYNYSILVLTCTDLSKLASDLSQTVSNRSSVEIRSIDTNPTTTVGRVAEGLAWSSFHHLKTFVPQIIKDIKANQYYHQKKLPAKYFILVPYSCNQCEDLSFADTGKIKSAGSLGPKQEVPIYEILAGQEQYFACVEYCKAAKVLYKMAPQSSSTCVSPQQFAHSGQGQNLTSGNVTLLSQEQKAAELRLLYEILYDLLNDTSAPDDCRNVKLVYYNDEDTGRNLSEILVEEIKECLAEEMYDDSNENQYSD